MVFKNNPGCGCCDGCPCAPDEFGDPTPDNYEVSLPDLNNGDDCSTCEPSALYTAVLTGVPLQPCIYNWSAAYPATCGEVYDIEVRWDRVAGKNYVQIDIALGGTGAAPGALGVVATDNNNGLTVNATISPSIPTTSTFDCDQTWTLTTTADVVFNDAFSGDHVCTLPSGSTITLTPPI